MEQRENLQILSAQPNTFALWDLKDGEFWITRVWAFQATSAHIREEWITHITPISGDFSEGYEGDCSNQIIYVGTETACKEEQARIEKAAKEKQETKHIIGAENALRSCLNA